MLQIIHDLKKNNTLLLLGLLGSLTFNLIIFLVYRDTVKEIPVRLVPQFNPSAGVTADFHGKSEDNLYFRLIAKSDVSLFLNTSYRSVAVTQDTFLARIATTSPFVKQARELFNTIKEEKREHAFFITNEQIDQNGRTDRILFAGQIQRTKFTKNLGRVEALNKPAYVVALYRWIAGMPFIYSISVFYEENEAVQFFSSARTF